MGGRPNLPNQTSLFLQVSARCTLSMTGAPAPDRRRRPPQPATRRRWPDRPSSRLLRAHAGGIPRHRPAGGTGMRLCTGQPGTKRVVWVWRQRRANLVRAAVPAETPPGPSRHRAGQIPLERSREGGAKVLGVEADGPKQAKAKAILRRTLQETALRQAATGAVRPQLNLLILRHLAPRSHGRPSRAFPLERSPPGARWCSRPHEPVDDPRQFLGWHYLAA